MFNLKVLIAGGGIAGLALAAALRRFGCDADLIERDARWEPVGGGIAVQPNAMRVLDELGIGASVQQAGAIVRRWQFRDQHGDVLSDIELDPVWKGIGSFIGIERTRLHDALRSTVTGCRLGTWVVSLTRDDSGVSVRFNDGVARRYDLVVGADGIHSELREFALGGIKPTYGGQMVWRSVAPIRPPEPHAVQFWLGDGCFFGLCPVGAGIYGFANITGPRAHDAVAGRLQRLRDRFAAFGLPIQDYLAALEHDQQVHCGPIEWLETVQWQQGRVVLIGDAAHASSPMMGQGGSMAMEDALVLAKSLSTISSVETAIAMFVARRQRRIDWVQQQSRRAGDMLGRPSADRNVALRERGEAAFYDRFQPLAASQPIDGGHVAPQAELILHFARAPNLCNQV
jgi:2-polyprenyl-6-methoxyphenol hydroxylase-like FAD-dependent oxidoreductase